MLRGHSVSPRFSFSFTSRIRSHQERETSRWGSPQSASGPIPDLLAGPLCSKSLLDGDPLITKCPGDLG